MLTLAELHGLPTLKKGSAVYFKETLHPFQSARQTKTQIDARGTFEDGGTFHLQVEEAQPAETRADSVQLTRAHGA